ncbi:bifunctional methylenetetrahydrofolate dehydrogenase/methenyltetrahydrofolate cyclohydrolase FolD [Lacticaseibacillus nasuensis]|uniref:Bifunctional protein FolD n=3 Tax=Lacticaseibacillus TaxID=2759736 RepID=A0A0R1K0C9_9LACO|nr:bifunctional methylenetetrahydrofolate dehydrogenase/methenyltetrahydrofolate cyclohydrolase FolD [Lacticaseibacillus nasuensis]KRK74292.1 bifunctional 5,10-methylene-tetrahydrofolate dehydrogenase 5,10-methylene-tetrahydrofolate cyclohydrolase [Lacticaseibacillus nasuensis JCM 17158]
MTIRLDGNQTANALMNTLQGQVAALKTAGVVPGLAVILVGDDPASAIYVRNKRRRAAAIGVASTVYTLPATATQAELLAQVAALNADPSVDGILVQLPLPPQIDAAAVIVAIAPDKDVDGFHPVNVGRLWTNTPGIVASTPYGIMALLHAYGIHVAGLHAVIVGRSNIVGRPLAGLLLNHDATVTIAHRQTAGLAALTRTADLLVVATGQANLITADMVKPGAVVVDVGMNRDAAGKLTGDVDYAAVAPKTRAITPVPGGVGPMTIAALMMQTVALAERRANG